MESDSCRKFRMRSQNLGPVVDVTTVSYTRDKALMQEIRVHYSAFAPNAEPSPDGTFDSKSISLISCSATEDFF